MPEGEEEREIFMEDLYAEEDAQQVALSQLKAHMEAQGMKWEEPAANGERHPGAV